MAAKIFPTKKPKIQSPASHEDWKTLMRQVIARAETTGDRRLAGLRQAQVSGDIESYLRKLGIISPQDIQREFPNPE